MKVVGETDIFGDRWLELECGHHLRKESVEDLPEHVCHRCRVSSPFNPEPASRRVVLRLQAEKHGCPVRAGQPREVRVSGGIKWFFWRGSWRPM